MKLAKWNLMIWILGLLGNSLNRNRPDPNIFSELIRLDNVNVCDVNIMFCVNATIHPLEHASVLFVKDPHYDDTG